MLQILWKHNRICYIALPLIMDADEFLKRELNINGTIYNLVHHLTYAEIKRLVINYARLQQRGGSDVHKPGISEDNTEDPGKLPG